MPDGDSSYNSEADFNASGSEGSNSSKDRSNVPENSSNDDNNENNKDADYDFAEHDNNDDDERSKTSHTEHNESARRYSTRNRQLPQWYVASTVQSAEDLKTTSIDDPSLSEIINDTPGEPV